MKDNNQGAAAAVFLAYYTCALAYIIYCLFTRRAKRYIFGVLTFAILRLGANISALGWAIHLYDQPNWLTANLILGGEGYFALVVTMLFCIVGYEKEILGSSVFYPEIPEGRNKWLHRMTHIAFWFEWSLIPANVLVIMGGSYISNGLARAARINPSQLSDPSSIPSVKLGQTLRLIGQSLFLVAILAGYAALLFVVRRAGRLGKPREALWWMAASTPFMVLRGIFGLVSAAEWSWSYYVPTNYGPNGLLRSKLLAEYLMAVTPEAISLVLFSRTIWLITMPKHLFVPYDKRTTGIVEGGGEMGETGNKART